MYAPKDDPHRDRWREPYPADLLADLTTLIGAATANHVRFTFAVSPGVSICYGDPADRAALVAKLDALYAGRALVLGGARRHRPHPLELRGRQRPLRTAVDGGGAAAQVELLNAVQHDFVAQRPGTLPLQMVPTEYAAPATASTARCCGRGWTRPSR